MSNAELPEEGLWCYLVSIRGQLYAIPDDERTTLLPHIGRVENVVPLPLGLVPSYVLGLVNVNQAAEVVVDLGAFLGQEGEIGGRDERRICVLSESEYDPMSGYLRPDPYCLGFAIDAGYELAEIETPSMDTVSNHVRALVSTARGEASLLNMENICSTIIAELGAERPWNSSALSEGTDAIAGPRRGA